MSSRNMGGDPTPAYGKRVKSSKVRVTWQYAGSDDLQSHQIELKHSIVSGKKELSVDGTPVFANKQFMSGSFQHFFTIGNHELKVKVEDTFEGTLYDLIIDNVSFHRLQRKTMSQLDELREKRKEDKAPTLTADFSAFTGVSRAVLDGQANNKAANVTTEDLDWAFSAVSQPVQQQQQQRGGVGASMRPSPQYGGPSNSAPQPLMYHASQDNYQPYHAPSQTFSSQVPPENPFPQASSSNNNRQAYDPFS